MKDVRDVLCQKEKDVERVRREIRALLTVIPLLVNDNPVLEDVMSLLDLSLAERVDQPTNNGMADLETYYPFVRHMRLSERA
jgi:hypothetical protein